MIFPAHVLCPWLSNGSVCWRESLNRTLGPILSHLDSAGSGAAPESDNYNFTGDADATGPRTTPSDPLVSLICFTCT